ncbi:karyopherin Kap95 [Savitreella phatthalungensis]
MDVGQLLSNSLSPDAGVRANATEQLEAASRDHFDQYMSLLSQQLANEQSPSHIRNASGLALKNALSAKDITRRAEAHQKWKNLPIDLRSQIKSATLETLGTNDSKAGQSAAQFLAAISAVELPSNEWPELMPRLVENVQITNPEHIKQASLQAIGYICEVVESDALAAQSNAILTAVVQGARKDEPSPAVRLAAVSALYDSLEFVRENFEREGERNYIMQVVCEATQATETPVQVAAFGCLVRIMQLYYDKMRFYMEKALFGLTVLGMKHDDEQVALQAVEFWSTVCEEEIEVALDNQEALELGERPERESFQFAKVAMPEVLPVLLQLLTKQDEDADEDDWNVSMAAGTCLQLFAQCVEGQIVQPVLSFVEQNIRSSDWKFREASVMAFGSILEGPEPEALKPLIQQAFGILLSLMSDPVLQVKDTTAWTLGRVSDFCITAISNDQHLPQLVQVIIQSLQDNPRIISNACWTIMNLAEQLGGSDEQPSAPISPFYEPLFGALLRVTETAPHENNARTSAYEALSTMVSHSAADVLPMVSNLTNIVLQRLQQTGQMRAQILSADEKVQFEELQGNLLSVLTSITRRCGSDISPVADRIMTILLELEQSQPRQSVVHEDIFLAISAICNSVNGHFAVYLDSFAPFLYSALQNHEEFTMCSIAIGLIGDISRALGDKVQPYCDNFMSALLQNLQSPVLNRTVKPNILSCFGDIALAINENFAKYLDVVMQLLQQASGVSYTSDASFDMIDYVNALREGIVEAYTGIVQALKGSPQSQALANHVQGMFTFLSVCHGDAETPERLRRAIIGLIGDLAESFPQGQLKPFLQQDWVAECLKMGRARGVQQSTKEVAKWANEHVKIATR